MVCIGGGIFAGINGKIYEGGTGPTAKATEAPILAWVLGGVALLLGVLVLSVAFAKPQRPDEPG